MLSIDVGGHFSLLVSFQMMCQEGMNSVDPRTIFHSAAEM